MHDFIFIPGVWLGEGTLSLPAVRKLISFYTRWQIKEINSRCIEALQIVEMEAQLSSVINHWTFDLLNSECLNVTLESEFVGKVTGKGRIDAKSISWAFEEPKEIDPGLTATVGSECYERGEDGIYYFQAKYGSSKDFVTIIDGHIWKK